MDKSNIKHTQVVFSKLLFGPSQPSIGVNNLEHKLLFSITSVGVRPEKDALKMGFSLTNGENPMLPFTIQGDVIVAFNRRIEEKELNNANIYQITITEAVTHIIEVIANNTSRMGMTPMLFDKQVIKNLMEGSAAKLSFPDIVRSVLAQVKS